jgi:hypothetical protein
MVSARTSHGLLAPNARPRSFVSYLSTPSDEKHLLATMTLTGTTPLHRADQPAFSGVRLTIPFTKLLPYEDGDD